MLATIIIMVASTRYFREDIQKDQTADYNIVLTKVCSLQSDRWNDLLISANNLTQTMTDGGKSSVNVSYIISAHSQRGKYPFIANSIDID